jgi:hypothetical protein
MLNDLLHPDPTACVLTIFCIGSLICLARLRPRRITNFALLAAILTSGAPRAAAIEYTTIDDSAAVPGTTRAYGIDNGRIVGTYTDANSSQQFGFLFDGSTFSKLQYPGSIFTTPTAISGNQIAGWAEPPYPASGFVYDGSTYALMPAPPEGIMEPYAISGKDIVGMYGNVTRPHGFLYNGSTYTTIDDPLGYYGTVATGIFADRTVGQYIDASNHYHGFIFSNGVYTTLDDPSPGTVYTSIGGIQGSNIVGSFRDASGLHGFLFDGSTYTTLDDPALPGSMFPRGISGNTITGYVLVGPSHGSIASFSAVIPEPSTLALAALGFMALVAYRLRRRLAQ